MYGIDFSNSNFQTKTIIETGHVNLMFNTFWMEGAWVPSGFSFPTYVYNTPSQQRMGIKYTSYGHSDQC